MKSLKEWAKEFYLGELKDEKLYRELSKKVRDRELREFLSRIAEIEEEHARFWSDFLQKRKEKLPEGKGGVSQKIITFLTNFLNPFLIVSLLELGESNAYVRYYTFLKEMESELTEEEKERIKAIILDELSHESTFREKSEKLGLSNIRDMILGMNDGLVELLGVVAGLSAVYRHEPILVGISAIVVGVAGAISMGIGAFVSVRSQRQVNEALRRRERILSEIKGTQTKVQEVKESELRSALFTALSYLTGVVLPIAPYFFVSNSLTALGFSLIFAIALLSFIGGFVAFISGISLKIKVFEMVLSAGFATGASFLIGKLVKSVFGLEV